MESSLNSLPLSLTLPHLWPAGTTERLLAERRSRLATELGPPSKPPIFRGAALDIQSYTGREFIIAGPSETGKTWAALWHLDQLLRDTPRAEATIIRKQRSTMDGTVLVTWQRIQQRRKAMGQPEAEIYGGNSPRWFSYPNGARAWIAGMDDSGKVLSAERDFIYVNQAEELLRDDWEVLLTRCTGRGAQTLTPMLFGDCNPNAENHWILKRESLKLFHSKHEDNPSLMRSDGTLTPQGVLTMSTLDSLTGVRKQRLRYGHWVGAEGQFFEEWDVERHTCDPFPIPEDWRIWGAFDYGFAHNTAFGLLAENEGVIYLVAEHVKNKMLVPHHCLAIRRQVERAGVAMARVTTIAAGHDVFQEKGDSGGKTIAAQYAKAVDPISGTPIGLPMQRANIARIPGAQQLVERLGNKELGIEPTLKLFKTCTRTIAAMARMVTDKNDPEDVLKVDADANGEGGDDEYDMLRYGVMARSVVWEVA